MLFSRFWCIVTNSHRKFHVVIDNENHPVEIRFVSCNMFINVEGQRILREKNEEKGRISKANYIISIA